MLDSTLFFCFFWAFAFHAVFLLMAESEEKLDAHPPVDAIPPQDTSGGETPIPPANPPFRAEVPPAPHHQQKTCKCKPDQTPLWKIVLECTAVAVGLAAVFIYGWQLDVMKRSAEDAHRTLKNNTQAICNIQMAFASGGVFFTVTDQEAQREPCSISGTVTVYRIPLPQGGEWEPIGTATFREDAIQYSNKPTWHSINSFVLKKDDWAKVESGDMILEARATYHYPNGFGDDVQRDACWNTIKGLELPRDYPGPPLGSVTCTGETGRLFAKLYDLTTRKKR